jgi:nucleotide-binding universal stress UspA family protein
MYQHILLPTDGSALSESAVVHGIELAKSLGARVTGFTAIPEFHIFTYKTTMIEETRGEYARESEATATKNLRLISDKASAAGVACNVSFVLNDRAAEAIVKAAKDKGCDLIVMGSHGRSGLPSVILGSVTQRVLAHSTVPVLVHRARQTAKT